MIRPTCLPRLICVRSICVVVLAFPVVSVAQLLTNGGFELPDVGGPLLNDYFLTIGPGQEGPLGFTGWTVDQGNVDAVDIPDLNSQFGTDFVAYEGDQLLDLHGSQGGVLHQDFELPAGGIHRLFFAYSSNFANPPIVDMATVSITDVGNGDPLAPSIQISHGEGEDWKTSASFVMGSGAPARVTFASLIPGQPSLGGIFLDAVRIETVTCDLNGDTACDINDINLLYDEIANTTNVAQFDLDGNDEVGNGDIAAWLAIAGLENGKVYRPGDTNLDGSVLGGDFSILAANFGTSVSDPASGAYWGNGNFTGQDPDGQFAIAGNDFSLLAANFGLVSAQVPEPAGLAMLFLAVLWMGSPRLRLRKAKMP